LVKKATRRDSPEQRRPPWPVRPALVPAVLLFLGLGVFLLAVTEVGRFTREQVKDWDRFTLAYQDIQIPPPPFGGPAEFLTEVKELDDLPDRLRLLESDLSTRLANAFSSQPYVEKVERVIVVPSQGVEGQLVYRIPVLEVITADRLSEKPSGGRVKSHAKGELANDPGWYVDGKGVVLPRRKLSGPLPLLLTISQPRGRPGQSWGDAGIEGAAQTAAFLQSYQTKLKLRVFEITKDGLVLSTPAGTHVLWGHAPGSEAAGEAAAEVKRDRLLRYCERNGDLDKPGGSEHDVRPLRRFEPGAPTN